jgi:hypothetical protein
MEKEMSELLISVQEQARSLSQKLKWYNHFVDYINQVDSSLYNEGCEYADNCEDS